MTWITQVCGVSVDGGGRLNISTNVFIRLHINNNNISGLCLFFLTCLCEPGAGGVGVDGVKLHHLVEFRAFTDGHADERVRVLRDHQHLKDLQGTRQREVDVLPREEEEEGVQVKKTLRVSDCNVGKKD